MFRLTRDDTSGTLMVHVTRSGTATTEGGDYSFIFSPIMFANGQATADVNVTPFDDSTSEPTETLTLTIASGSYTIGTPSSATVNILDNDTPVVSVESTDTVEGGATGGFSFTRIGNLANSLTVNYTVGGTATSVTDYTSIGTSVVFAANEDRVEVDVEAFGDNTADDAETVVATISSGGSNYTIDSGAGAATVTIYDQPLSVSVAWLADGTEGAGNGSFRFTRYGDLTSALTVTYTVTGTAINGGMDYTSLSGSVTFAATVHTVDVDVTVNDDGLAEGTETVSVTLAEDDGYMLGNDSDTVLIRDNDTQKVYWVSTSSTDWSTAANWSTNAVPTAGQDVYFSGSGYASCTNAGSGLSVLSGLHLVNGYTGQVTLAETLSVGTYEQTSGTLTQYSSSTARDLTATGAFLWSGGTLNGTDNGAEVNISGAVGRIDPPDVGSMAIASTLNVVNGAVVTIVGGTLEFLGGEGMYITADVKLDFGSDLGVDIKLPVVVTQNRQIIIGVGGRLRVLKTDQTTVGVGATDMPILNGGGTVAINRGIHFIVNRRVAGDPDNQSIIQASGLFALQSDSRVVAEFGMEVTGGDLVVGILVNETQAVLNGDLTFDSTGVIGIAWIGAAESGLGNFQVEGNVTWNKGKYNPLIDKSANNKATLWYATGTFTIGADAKIEPSFVGTGAATDWKIIEGIKGITGVANPATDPNPNTRLPAGDIRNNYNILSDGEGAKKWWILHKK